MERPSGPPSTLAPPTPRSTLLRWLYLALALPRLLLGVIGIFLLLLPTTPIILLSAWAAPCSSLRLLAWLENHTAFGPMIRDCRRGGVVRRRAIWLATGVMGASALYCVTTCARCGSRTRPWPAWPACRSGCGGGWPEQLQMDTRRLQP